MAFTRLLRELSNFVPYFLEVKKDPGNEVESCGLVKKNDLFRGGIWLSEQFVFRKSVMLMFLSSSSDMFLLVTGRHVGFPSGLAPAGRLHTNI